MQPCSSPSCGNPQLNGYLCRRCAETLLRDLSALPWLLKDLRVTISRQDRIGDTSGPSGAETPLPLRLDPVEVKRDLHATLAAWAQHIAGKFDGLPPGVIWTEIRLAAWLIGHFGAILTDVSAGQLADEIGYARMSVQRCIDQPPEKVFVGPCDDCGRDLYANPRKAEVECRNPDCLRVYDITKRQDWLLSLAEDQLMTATALTRAIVGLLAVPLTASMVRNWANRGKLTPHPPLPDRPRDPVYRVGDVLNLLPEMAEEQARGRPRAC
jgi:hypothetical protein